MSSTNVVASGADERTDRLRAGVASSGDADAHGGSVTAQTSDVEMAEADRAARAPPDFPGI